MSVSDRYLDDLAASGLGRVGFLRKKCESMRAMSSVTSGDMDYINYLLLLEVSGTTECRDLCKFEDLAGGMRNADQAYTIRSIYLRHHPVMIHWMGKATRTKLFYNRLVADRVPFEVIFLLSPCGTKLSGGTEYTPNDPLSVAYLLDHNICPLAMMQLHTADVPMAEMMEVVARCLPYKNDVLKWAEANGRAWARLTSACAAENKHLDVLKWARANGCL